MKKSFWEKIIHPSFPYSMFSFWKKHEEHHEGIEVNVTEGEASIEEDIWQVALDILEIEDSIVVVTPLAGMDTDNVDIAIARNILTISGERTRPEVYHSAIRILNEECFFWPFSRSIILPENLELNKIHATMENNLMMIDIPKLRFPSKNIKIDKLEH